MNKTISHYRMLESLGRGGMGEVFKAEDTRLNRIVALKVLAPELAADPHRRQQLADEARAAAAINHPNIATIYEIGEDSDQLFIVMEYVEGQTLRSRIEKDHFELKTALGVAIQVAGALAAAHARGLIHCDLKDSNLMIMPSGVVKVLDFGLARTQADSASSSLPNDRSAIVDSFTRSSTSPGHDAVSTGPGTISGTLHYLSPEQIRGLPGNPQTDLFSLGVVLYQMVTGRRPFEGDERASVLKAILHVEPLRLGAYRDEIPLDLENVIRKALEKHRHERYATADAMLADLIAVQKGLETNASLGVRVTETFGIEPGESAGGMRDFIWRIRRLLLVMGALALLAAALDFVLVRLHGTWPRDVVLSTVGLLFLVVAYGARRHRSTRTIELQHNGAAFRGLLPFQEADRNRFYGRETDTTALWEMIRHKDFRFGVLFGESGSGKTSLLRAGLLPKLWDEGYVPVYCRSYKDPLGTALDEYRKLSGVNVVEGEPPADYLRRVAREMCSTLVVIWDQFEEFFISHRLEPEREEFLSFIAASHDDVQLPVKFLVSMRSDFLYLISSELGGRVGEPLVSSRIYHLRKFDEEQASEIIEKSAARAGLPFERGLSRQVARDLASGEVISPSEMQIVGAQLQSKRIYTLQSYRRAGGKEPLVHTFVEDVIQASGDAEGSRLLLRSLISEENTRVTWPLEQIARRIQRNTATVERLLRVFVRSRLIREIQDETPWRYELMHEYLIDKINQITGRVMDATQKANRLFRQYLSNYAVDKRTHIPIGKLWFIRRYSDIERHERERELLKRSLRLALLKAGATCLALTAVATLAGAALSVNEVWEGVRLNGGHTAAARKIAISPDGRLLVSAGEDEKVIVWDVARRERLATFTDHTAWIISVAFSPDGKWFATASDDHTVIVWDAMKLEKSATLTDHKSAVRAVAFSPDSKMLASASDGPDGGTIIWEVGRWQRICEWPRIAHWENIMFSPDGRNLIYAQGETWDVATKRQVAGRLDPYGGGTHAALSRDGAQLISIDSGGYVYFFDMIRRQEISRYRAHRFHGRVTALSPDNQLGASGADDIVLWDAVNQTKLARLICNTEVWGLAFSADGKWLISSHEDGSIVLWDVAERAPVANFNEHNGAVRAVAYSPDGRRLASASEDRSIIVWDARTGQKEATLTGHDARVAALAFSPDGQLMASSDQDGTHILWDLNSHQPRWTFDGSYFNENYQIDQRDSSYCLAFSPDGRFIATTGGVLTSADGQWVEHNDLKKRILLSVGVSAASIYGVAFSPDGKRLACAMTDSHLIYVLDPSNWQVIDSYKFSDALPSSLSFSADGRYLAAGEGGGAVLLLESNPLRYVGELGRHAARVKSVAFSPDGEEVASSSDDQTIALWSVRHRNLVTRIGTHTAPVLSVAFSPDGMQLASGEQDKSVRVYTRRRTLWGYRLD